MKKITFWIFTSLGTLFLILLIGGKFYENIDYAPQRGVYVQMKAISDRLFEFKRHCGRLPYSSEGLEVLTLDNFKKVKSCKDVPSEGFIEGGKVPKNPWGKDFIYTSDGKDYTLFTEGDEFKYIKKNREEPRIFETKE